MNRLLKSFFGLTLGVAFSLGVAASLNANRQDVTKTAEAADYSSTIRVYVDFSWDNINYVRVGGNTASNNTVSTTSNTKYRRDCGSRVLDISSSSTYERMGCFFDQGGTKWQYAYDSGYIWIDGDKFQPGYEFKIYNINWKADGNPKTFTASVTRLGKIKDCTSDATVYFVNGYSWADPHIHYWGGTATDTYPGNSMTETAAKLYSKVGDWWLPIKIYKYTISGTACFVQFNKGNDSEKTDDLDLENGAVYWFGVDADKYGEVANYLISFMGSMSSYTYNGKTYSNSICSFNSSTASSLVSTYGTLSSSSDEDVVTSITNSTINTYSTPVTEPGSTTDTRIPILIAQVEKNISTGVYGSLRSFGLLNMSDSNSLIIIVVISSLGILSVGGYYFFRKSRKAAE